VAATTARPSKYMHRQCHRSAPRAPQCHAHARYFASFTPAAVATANGCPQARDLAPSQSVLARPSRPGQYAAEVRVDTASLASHQLLSESCSPWVPLIESIAQWILPLAWRVVAQTLWLYINQSAKRISSTRALLTMPKRCLLP
jgi:hypothetical protein